MKFNLMIELQDHYWNEQEQRVTFTVAPCKIAVVKYLENGALVIDAGIERQIHMSVDRFEQFVRLGFIQPIE